MKNVNLELLEKQPEMRFLCNVYDSGNTKMNIIHTHLIAEEILNTIILKAFKVAGRFEKAKLKFHQKIHLAGGLLGNDFNEHVYALLIKLNSIRNQYSHRLEPDNIKDYLEDFVKQVPPVAFEKAPNKLDAVAAMLGVPRAPDKLYLSLRWIVIELVKISN